MAERKAPNILIEKINLERVPDFYAALDESREEWFAEDMIPKPDLSIEELEVLTKEFLKRWEDDDYYLFFIVDGDAKQALGFAFLNHVSRPYQMANLGYAVRTSRAGEGIATEAAKRVAQYGFERLGFERIEIVVRKDNQASLKVAEKTGAVREGLLRNRAQLHGSARDAYMHSLIPSDFGIQKTT